MTKTRSVTLVDALSTLRKGDAPTTMEEIAQQVGVRQPTVSRWFNGKVVPSIDRAPKLAELLGYPVEEVEALITKAQRRGDRVTPERLKNIEEDGVATSARVSEQDREIASLREDVRRLSEELRLHVGEKKSKGRSA